MATSIQVLYNEQNGKCFYCTIPMAKLNGTGEIKQTRSTPTFDHIILKSNGGKANLTNGVCACRVCNQLRGDINFDVFKTLVHDVVSRNQLRRQRHELRKKGRWAKVYPRCTLKVVDNPNPKTNLGPLPIITKAKRKNKRKAITVRMIRLLGEQGGKCACCNTYTLEVNRFYDDMTPKEYTVSPFRPLKVGNRIICSACFGKRKESKPNKWLTFFKNLL